MELTREQQKAIAMAKARQRAALVQKRDSLDASLQNSTLAGAAGGALSDIDDNMRLAANGISLGFLDKALGQEDRARTDAARGRQGYTGMLAETAGSMAVPGMLASKGVTAARIPGMIGKYGGLAIDGAAIGATQALGNDKDVLANALLGGALGGAGQIAAGGVNKALGAFSKKPPMMTGDALKAKGTAAYNEAEAMGVMYKPEAIARLRDTVRNDMAEFGYHPANQPGAKVAFDELSRMVDDGNSVTLKGLDTARKVTKGGFNPTNPSNNALINKIAERLDDAAMNAGPDDVLSGDPQAAAAAMGKARDYWSRFRKLEKVDELMARGELNAGATGSGGNIENATRQQLKRLLTDKKLTRGMTQDEIAAVRKAVLGSNTQNVLRLAGKLSPQGNGLMLAIHSALSATTPAVGLPVAAMGYGSKKISEALSRNSAEELRQIISAGGSKAAIKAPPNAAQKLLEAKKDAIIRALIAGGTSPAMGQR